MDSITANEAFQSICELERQIKSKKREVKLASSEAKIAKDGKEQELAKSFRINNRYTDEDKAKVKQDTPENRTLLNLRTQLSRLNGALSVQKRALGNFALTVNSPEQLKVLTGLTEGRWWKGNDIYLTPLYHTFNQGIAALNAFQDNYSNATGKAVNWANAPAAPAIAPAIADLAAAPVVHAVAPPDPVQLPFVGSPGPAAAPRASDLVAAAVAAPPVQLPFVGSLGPAASAAALYASSSENTTAVASPPAGVAQEPVQLAFGGSPGPAASAVPPLGSSEVTTAVAATVGSSEAAPIAGQNH